MGNVLSELNRKSATYSGSLWHKRVWKHLVKYPNLMHGVEFGKATGRHNTLFSSFAIADMAFRAVVHENRDECIMIRSVNPKYWSLLMKGTSFIFSGESGSGKTEASKKILQFIAQTSRHKGTVDDVKEKLLASNPLFEVRRTIYRIC